MPVFDRGSSKLTRVIVLTGSELRHQFVRKALALAPGLEVLSSICEGAEKSLAAVADRQGADAVARHASLRASSEHDFFDAFVKFAPDESRPKLIAKGDLNSARVFRGISDLEPELLVAYGCSLIKGDLLEHFDGRILNVHLGLSPYYRGSGTNIWPLVNGEPEFIGATFMYIDAGIDTGQIIHQMRARILPGDNPHQIGNRLICDLVSVYATIISNLDAIPPVASPGLQGREELVFRQSDFQDQTVETLYQCLRDGLIDRYLASRIDRCERAPIAENQAVIELLGTTQ